MESETASQEVLVDPAEILNPSVRRIDNAILTSIAAAVALAHLLTNGRYGFHRDELQFLNDARHLDWGFVSYPPLTPFLERILLGLFGLSTEGLRLFAVVAQGIAIFVTGLMARELGGGRLAQATSALAVSFAPLSLFEGTEFQYTAFDYLWWVLIAYFTIRLLTSENPKWWLAIGAAVGLGLLTKYAIVFYIAGILIGVVLTPARRFMKSQWFWMGIAVALLIFLPNFIWLLRHNFISYQFLQHIHARDVGQGRADGFWRDQALICVNLAAVPICVAGLIGFIINSRYRMLAWMYGVGVALFFFGKGRGYYTAGAYPMLMAMGAVMAERWTAGLPRVGKFAVRAAYFAAFAFVAAYVSALILPLADSGPLKQFALERNGDLREEFGWNELVATVALIRSSLPAEQQASVGILVGNYGEAGALEMFGPAYQLPPPLSITNSAWLRGYPSPVPSPLIVVGFGRERAERDFSGCRLAGHTGNREGVRNEESTSHPDIFVCDGPREPWPDFWKHHQWFG